MKKLLIAAMLLLLLTFAASSCKKTITESVTLTEIIEVTREPEVEELEGSDTVADTTSETPAETDPVTEPETVPETAPETVPETTPETEPATEPETDPETQPETSGNTPAETEAYYEYEWWDINLDPVSHVSFDKVKHNNMDGAAYVDSAEQYEKWDQIAVPNEGDTAVYFFGWIAYTDTNLGTFGYAIYDGKTNHTPVFKPSFSAQTEQAVIDTAKAFNGYSGHRYAITIPLSGLSGTNQVQILYRDRSGNIALIGTTTIQIPE